MLNTAFLSQLVQPFIQNLLIRREPGLGQPRQTDQSEPTKIKKVPLSSPGTSSKAREASILGSAEIHRLRRGKKRQRTSICTEAQSPIIPNQNGHSAGLWMIGPGVIQPVYAVRRKEAGCPRLIKREADGTAAQPLRDFIPANLPSRPGTRRFLHRNFAHAVYPPFLPRRASERASERSRLTVWKLGQKRQGQEQKKKRRSRQGRQRRRLPHRGTLRSPLGGRHGCRHTVAGDVASSRPAHPRC